MAEVWSSGDDPKSGLYSGFYPEGYNLQSPIYIPTVHPTPPRYLPKPSIYFPTPPIYDVPTTTSSKNAEDETPFYSTCRVSPAYYPCVSSDVPATTANNAQGPPPPSATTTLKAFEIQHAQAYESQQHNHQHGEGEEQLKEKPSSSGVPHSAIPPMPRGLGCIEEKQSAGERIPVLLNLTKEEGKIYDKIVCESDGFDCPYVRPEVMLPGLLKPYPLENISNVRRMEFDYMADLALKHYNDLNGWSYRLVEVIKATRRYAGGWVYNITLRAKDDKSGSPPQNFQGRVYDSMGKYKVLFCRVEGNAEPTAIGDSDKRPGCWVPKPLTFLPVGYSYSSSGHLIYGSSSDVPTTGNSTECLPPLSTTTTALTPAPRIVSPAFEIQHAQAYESQQHNHQHGEGEEQLKKKPSSSGVPHSAVPPMPRGLGCIEEKQSAGERKPVLLNLTKEEGKIYDKIVCESDGFDCPYVRPEVMVPGMLKPYPLENISNVRRMEFDYMADLALKHYSDLNGWSYRLVEVIKATRRYAGGWVYNITLRAKDDKSGSPPQNFQGRVYDSMGKYKVLFCRVEGNAERTAIGDSDERPGCWVPKPLTFLPVGYSYSLSGHLIYGSYSDVPITTANNTECPPPPSTTTTTSTPELMTVSPAFEMQHEKYVRLAEAYKSQQHNHQHGEGEEQAKKPRSS